MTADPLELAGLIAGCGGAAAGLLVEDRWLRYAAMALALAMTPALVAGDVWYEPRVVDLRSEPAIAAGGIALAVVAALAMAAGFRRFAWAFPVAAFALLPLRVPLRIGEETSNLLLPLYLVIAAGLLAAIWSLARDQTPVAREPTPRPAAARWVLRLLAATLVLYALQASYSRDVSNAIENAAFFLIPFAVLAGLLLEVRWTPRLLAVVLTAVGAVAVAFSALAFWQYAVRDLTFNKDLLDANQLHLYFCVNSVFHDPNVLARYLALAIVGLGAALAWDRGRAILLAAATAVMLAALALTFSLTSFAALIAGLLVLAALRWHPRWTLAAVTGALVAGAVFLLAGGAGRSELGPDRGLEAETGGRVNLVSGGLELAAERPVAGWGSGAFGAAFLRQIEDAKTTTSHSEPITVAAEQGALGLIVYGATVVVALLTVFGAGVRASPARSAVAACFVALLVHSIGYASFAINPATWALLALAISLAGPATSTTDVATSPVRPARAAAPA